MTWYDIIDGECLIVKSKIGNRFFFAEISKIVPFVFLREYKKKTGSAKSYRLDSDFPKSSYDAITDLEKLPDTQKDWFLNHEYFSARIKKRYNVDN